jgi:hypothetical protein
MTVSLREAPFGAVAVAALASVITSKSASASPALVTSFTPSKDSLSSFTQNWVIMIILKHFRVWQTPSASRLHLVCTSLGRRLMSSEQ